MNKLSILSLTLTCAITIGISPTHARLYYGLLSASGKEILPCDYVDIKREGNNFVVFPKVEPVPTNQDAYLVDSHGVRIPDAKPDFTPPKRIEYGSEKPAELKFSEGLAPRLIVEPNYGTEYLDEHHNVAIKFIPDTLAYEFHHGLAIAWNRKTNNDHYGAIDKSGNMVIPQKYDLLTRSGDYIFARMGDETYILSDQGKLLLHLPSGCSAVYGPDENGWFRYATGGKSYGYPAPHHPYPDATFGYIDIEGNIKIPATYEKAEPFQSGFAVVAVKADRARPSADDNLMFGVIDQNNHFVIEPKFAHLDRDRDIIIAGAASGAPFDPYRWKNSSHRVSEWKNFLDSYNLIGMSKDEVISLLGEYPNYRPDGPILENHFTTPKDELPRIASYGLGSANWCGNTAAFVELLFDETNTKVIAWRNGSTSHFSDWCRENVVFNIADVKGMSELIHVTKPKEAKAQ